LADVAAGARLDAFDSNSSSMGCFMHRDLPAIDNLEALLEKHYEIFPCEASLFTIRGQGKVSRPLSFTSHRGSI
jgi:hypothetical protein